MDGNPSEKVRKLAEDALKRLSDEMAAGQSETLKTYLAAMSRFRRYSWGNVLLIASQRPTATHVAGFHAWRDLDRFVKKGEKGIMIFAPVVVKKEPVPESPAPEQAKAPFRLAGFRAAYVFDVTQTQGKPLPQFATTSGDPQEYTEKLKAFVAKRGIAVEYDRAIAPAQGVSTGGCIRLLPELSKAEEFSVLAHELAHEMLHHTPAASALPKVVRETQAEAVAFVVCRGIGLETNTAASDYLALYNADQTTLAKSLAVVQGASAKILDELLPEPRNVAQARAAEEGPADAGMNHVGPAKPPDRADSGATDLTRDSGPAPIWDR